MPEPDYLQPQWGSAAVVIVDLQADFLDGGALPVPGTSAIVGKVAELARAFRSAGRPIAHIVRLYEPGGSDVDLPRRASVEAGAKIVAPGSGGSQIPESVLGTSGPSLDPEVLLAGEGQQLAPDEVVFFKPRWSAFYRTGLEAWLRGRGVTTVVVAGCNLPNCPRATLFDASERDLRAVLAVDAVSQVTDERLSDLRAIGVNLLSVEAVLEQLGS